MALLQSFFNTPARQALGWAVLGIFGIAMAAGGIWFLTDDGGGGPRVADADDSTPAATATASPTRTSSPTNTATASPSPSPSPTETPVPTATPRPASQTSAGTGGAVSATEPEPEPPAVPEPTQPPVVAGGAYCPPNNGGGIPSPPNSVIGPLTIGGALAPAGTEVGLAFDGVLGPSRATTAAGGYRVDYAGGQAGCANQFGAAISVVVNGQYYATGHTIGDSPGVPVYLEIAAP